MITAKTHTALNLLLACMVNRLENEQTDIKDLEEILLKKINRAEKIQCEIEQLKRFLTTKHKN